jgi:hypothetical protein
MSNKFAQAALFLIDTAMLLHESVTSSSMVEPRVLETLPSTILTRALTS